uniref:RING-type E3 ubiquitin transferase n=1 Tax=Ciona intestinalis TaxID=7719 RepID=F6YGU3_CIOIN|nr:baculoviral IAP repeat-containing protein 3 [Ciona intestinalis]|eukprot:XP_002127578.1 baculoviral IAP repeat-containing protein 3 [Ciona intestinalis]
MKQRHKYLHNTRKSTAPFNNQINGNAKDKRNYEKKSLKSTLGSKGLHELCLFETFNPEVCKIHPEIKGKSYKSGGKKLRESANTDVQSDGTPAANDDNIAPTPERASEMVFRLLSFKERSDLNGKNLTNSGFYLEPGGSVIRCYSCGFRVENVTDTDSGDSAQYHNDDCAHFKQLQSKQPIALKAPPQPPSVEGASFLPSMMDDLDLGLGNQDLQFSIYDPSLTEPYSGFSFENDQKLKYLPQSVNDVSMVPNTSENNEVSDEECPQIYLAQVYSAEHREFLHTLNLNKESGRLKSFRNWPDNSLDKTLLAKSGFFYLGNRDRTQCFSCMGVLKNWRPGDVINDIHRDSFPSCSFANAIDTPAPALDDYDFSIIRGPPSETFDMALLLNNKPSEARISFEPANQSPTRDIYSSGEAEQMISDPLSLSLPQSSGELPALNFPQFTSSENAMLNQAEPVSAFRPISSNLLNQSGSSFEITNSSSAASKVKKPSPIFPQPLTPAPVAPPPLALPALDFLAYGETHDSSIVSNTSSKFQTIQISNPESKQASNLQPWLNLNTTNAQILIPTPSRTSPQSPLKQVQTAPQDWLLDLDPYKAPLETQSAQPVRDFTFSTTSTSNPEDATTIPIIRSLEGIQNGKTLDFDEYLQEQERTLYRDMFPCLEPKKMDMKFYEDRIATFDSRWTRTGPPTMSDIAQAGFYYLGDDDAVRCWYCDVTIRDLSRQWIPWEEHAKQFPSCHYLLRNRGPDFVENVLSIMTSAESGEPSFPTFPGEIYESSDEEDSRENLPTPPIVDPREEERQNKLQLEQCMSSEIAANAAEMGFEPKNIRRVMRKQIRERSCNFPTTDALLDALFNEERDLIEFESSEDDDEDGVEDNPEEPESFFEARDRFHDDEHEHPDVSVHESQDETHETSVAHEENHEEEERRIQAELRRLRDEKRCKVCLDRDAEMVFVPCGHLCTCMQCTQSLRQCPVCRMRITKAYRTYPS